MPKYRRLSLEEVQNLEKEFIDFLVVNGIPSDDWVKIKENDIQQAEGIIDSFSDVVFEKILRNCRYLIKHSEAELATVVCLNDRFHMIAMKFEDEKKENISEIYTSEKVYNDVREKEIWELISNERFDISDGKEYLSMIDKIK